MPPANDVPDLCMEASRYHDFGLFDSLQALCYTLSASARRSFINDLELFVSSSSCGKGQAHGIAGV
jgi:hypothetical protein